MFARRGNQASAALYKSLGFHVLDENVAYDRLLQDEMRRAGVCRRLNRACRPAASYLPVDGSHPNAAGGIGDG